MSIQLDMILEQMKAQKQSFHEDFDVENLRQTAQMSAQIPPEKDVDFAEILLGSRNSDMAIPPKPREDAVIMYIHGGGFVSGNPKYVRSFTSFLAKKSKMKVYGITYRMAPEYQFPAGPNDCLESYEALVQMLPDKKIIVLGESAGATYAIVTALMARDKNIRLPDAVVAYAPCGDITGRIDRAAYKDTDPVIGYNALDKIRNLYCPEDADDPYASICLADYKGFPPIRIVWDAGEVLSPDSREIVNKAEKAGVHVEAKEWKNTFHTFELLGAMLPEAVEEINDTVRFINNYI